MLKKWARALDKFIAGMAEKLELNKDKGGWKQNKNDKYLHKRLLEEVAEYFKSGTNWSDLDIVAEFISAVASVHNVDTSKKGQKGELADIGNISMMLYDNT